MLQPAVLPSNAPPLQTQHSDPLQASRVLREHYGNRQTYEYANPAAVQQKYRGHLLAENAYPTCQFHQPSAQLYQPQTRSHQPLRLPYGRGRRAPDGDALADAVIAENAKRLYRRFTRSEGYKKYRERQPKESKDDQKWPDHVEEAFFRALVAWPPMGRRKTILPHRDAKQRGRNELIADYILDLTGENRTRKQVSSHIQVLKPFVAEDKFIMQYLSKDDLSGLSSAQRNGYGGGGRRMSHHPVMGPPRNNVQSGARGSGGSATPHGRRGDSEVIEPTDFHMFVQQMIGDDANTLHTYTHSTPGEKSRPLQISDHATLFNRYPLLGRIHERRQLDCNVILADTTLAVPLKTWKDHSGIELGISFICSSRMLTNNTHVYCYNSFFERDVQIPEHSEKFELCFAPSESQRGVADTQVKFASRFWAKTFFQLSLKLNRAQQTGSDAQDEVARHLKKITATQEFVVAEGNGRHERVLIIHWNFQSSSQDVGHTTWRKLHVAPTPAVPLQHYDMQLQHLPFKQEPTNNIDPLFDFNAPLTDTGFASNTQAQVQQSQPSQLTAQTLQSPFSYNDSQSNLPSGCDITDAWPTSISENNTAPNSAHPDSQSQMEVTFPSAFDFTGCQINMSYGLDPAFETFDSTAFDFDINGDLSSLPQGDAEIVDFAVEPGLDQYSQQNWYPGTMTGPESFEASQSFSATNLQEDSQVSQATHDFNIGPLHADSAYESQGTQPPQGFDDYDDSFDSQDHYRIQSIPEQAYETGTDVNGLRHEQQAYGGAGRDGMVFSEAGQEGTALAALADASFLMGPMESRLENHDG